MSAPIDHIHALRMGLPVAVDLGRAVDHLHLARQKLDEKRKLELAREVSRIIFAIEKLKGEVGGI